MLVFEPSLASTAMLKQESWTFNNRQVSRNWRSLGISHVEWRRSRIKWHHMGEHLLLFTIRSGEDNDSPTTLTISWNGKSFAEVYSLDASLHLLGSSSTIGSLLMSAVKTGIRTNKDGKRFFHVGSAACERTGCRWSVKDNNCNCTSIFQIAVSLWGVHTS